METEENKGLGIFGGTFNPIHMGHLRLAQEVCKRMDLEKIVFVPDALPPHKLGTGFAPAQDRFNMVQLAIQEYPNFIVSDIELRRTGLSYTIDTLRELHDIHPNKDLYFIIGADSVQQLHTWHNAHEMIQLATFVGVVRPGYDAVLDEAVKHFGEIAKKRILLLDTPKYDISATKIRERIAEGLPIDGLVPDCVKQYIEDKGLYRGQDEY